MKRLSLFPRSLRQLVTLSFVLILLPLLVLAWQAWQSLNALSAQAAHINRTTLVDARRSEAMINAALEMERSYRQYCVLDDPTLARVYQNQRASCPMRKSGRRCVRMSAIWRSCSVKIADPMPRQPPDWKFSPVITAIWCRRPGRSSILVANSCSRR